MATKTIRFAEEPIVCECEAVADPGAAVPTLPPAES